MVPAISRSAVAVSGIAATLRRGRAAARLRGSTPHIHAGDGIDAASLVPPCPGRQHKLFGELRDLALLLLAAAGLVDQGRDKPVFISEQRFAEPCTAR